MSSLNKVLMVLSAFLLLASCSQRQSDEVRQLVIYPYGDNPFYEIPVPKINGKD